MKTNTIVELYKGCVLTEEKNFIVDGLLQALASNYSNIRSSDSDGRLIFNNVQYQKIKLNMNLKLVGDETMLTQFGNYFYPSNNYNYLHMQQYLYDDNDNIVKVGYYYFFVKKCKWLSQNCVELDIKLDTLNTYGYQLNNEVSAKSHTLRRHKDRFSIASQTGTDFNLYPLVDFYSEGINATKYRNPAQDRTITEQTGAYNQNWYVVYQNNAELENSYDLSKAVQCFLYSGNAQTLPIETYDATIDIYVAGYGYANPLDSHEPDSTWYHIIFLTYEDNGPTTFEFYHEENSVHITDGYVTLDSSTNYMVMISWTTTGTCVLEIRKKNGALVDAVAWATSIKFVTSNTFYAYRTLSILRSDYSQAIGAESWLDYIHHTSTYHNAGGGRQAFTTKAFSNLDRSDSKLIKVIKLPYCPVQSNSSYVRFNWDTNGFELLESPLGYSRNITANLVVGHHPFSPLLTKSVSKETISLNTTTRNINYEPKLYHSDYHISKFVYDSFSFDFKLETQDVEEVNQLNMLTFTFSFTLTSTINSRFMFTFDFLSQNVNTYVVDYENILVIARNNEMALYNQQYINYLRAGYNYDVKSKTRTEAFTWASVAVGTGGGALSGALSGKFLGPVGVAGGAVVGAIVGATTSIMNSIKTTIDAEENFARKQEELRLQATQVYGADDVDLMSKYTSNRAKLVQYNVSQKVKSLLYNLFYYYGYVSDEYGNPFANGWHNSRHNFNFLQCELVFNTQWADSEIIEDLVDKFKVGATIFHKTTSGGDTNFYDFTQVLENWESTLYA